MYYSIFEGVPLEGKGTTVEAYYKSLLPKVKQIDGFQGDMFFGSPHFNRRAVNIAEWDDAEAVSRWRNEASHLRAQKKGGSSFYEAYRLRMGSDSFSQDHDTKTRHYALLYYRENDHVEGTPAEDVTSLLKNEDVGELKSKVLDSFVYQGPSTVWISSWSTTESIAKFEEAIQKQPGDKAVRVQVLRDYTKSERSDAPHETPGEPNNSAVL